jgi:drug/metabolite transporter (DMT)-like permease
MSLVASDRAPVGVAQTLCSLTPIFLAPVAAWVYRERISLRAVLGAFVAVGGASLLFF